MVLHPSRADRHETATRANLARDGWAHRTVSGACSPPRQRGPTGSVRLRRRRARGRRRRHRRSERRASPGDPCYNPPESFIPKERPHGTKEGVGLSPGTARPVPRIPARRHRPPHVPGSRREVRGRRPDRGGDLRRPQAELRVGAAGAEGRRADQDRVRNSAVAAGQRQHQGLLRAAGERRAASCRPCSSSTRTAG